eukprot:2072958-Amphidinium_carterae.1
MYDSATFHMYSYVSLSVDGFPQLQCHMRARVQLTGNCSQVQITAIKSTVVVCGQSRFGTSSKGPPPSWKQRTK